MTGNGFVSLSLSKKNLEALDAQLKVAATTRVSRAEVDFLNAELKRVKAQNESLQRQLDSTKQTLEQSKENYRKLLQHNQDAENQRIRNEEKVFEATIK